MSETMLKKYGVSGLGEQPRSRSPNETTLYAEEITERVMQKMGFGQTNKRNGTDFSGLVI